MCHCLAVLRCLAVCKPESSVTSPTGNTSEQTAEKCTLATLPPSYVPVSL